MTITFSIIIPTRNGERYIAAALQSALNQTYPEVVVIVLESGSADRTREIVNDYADPRLRVRSSPDALDIVGNWARIADLDIDGYMTILGHDDVLYPTFCEEIARLIQAEPAASLYCTHFHFIDAASRVLRPCLPVPYIESADDFLLARHQFRRDSSATGYVMRATDYRQLGGFPPFAQLIHADDITWYHLSERAHKVCSPAFAFAFRLHGTNAAQIASAEQWYHAAQDYYTALDNAGHLADHHQRKAARRFIEYGVNGHMHNMLVRLIESGNPAQIAEYHAAQHRIRVDHAQRPRFSIYDWPTRLYEMVLALPGPVNRICLAVIRQARALRRWWQRRWNTARTH